MARKVMKTDAGRAKAKVTVNLSSAAQVTDADRDAVMGAIATIKDRLPFLIDLTAEERRSLPKMSMRGPGLVNCALELIEQEPDFLPRSFDIEQMQQDAVLWKEISAMLFAMEQLQELMDDTYVGLGSKVYTDAKSVYQYAKTAKHTGRLEAVVTEMAQYFSRKPRKKTSVNDVSSEGSPEV